MATYEYPPAFNQSRALIRERNGIYKICLQLGHHFFLTRLKMVLKEVFRMEPNQYLTDGIQNELDNFLKSHGACTAVGLKVPSPYFVQQLILGPTLDPDGPPDPAALWRLFVSLEVSDHDKAFVNNITAGLADWWTLEAAQYPSYTEFSDRIVTGMEQLWKEGPFSPESPLTPVQQLRVLVNNWSQQNSSPHLTPSSENSHPISTNDSRSDVQLAPTLAATNAAGATVDGDAAMNVDPAQLGDSGTNAGVDDPIMRFAIDLDFISPETPLLSEEDRHDLLLFDKTTQMQAQLQQLMGLEAEVVETEKWNLDAISQLLELSLLIGKIPFASRAELFDLEPTSAEYSSAAKGKQRSANKPRKRSIYHILPEKAKQAWAGSEESNPLPAKPLHSKVQDFDSLLPILFPDWFGPTAEHQCFYRELLFETMKVDLQHRTTESLAELLRKSTATNVSYDFWSAAPAYRGTGANAQSSADKSSNSEPSVKNRIHSVALPIIVSSTSGPAPRSSPSSPQSSPPLSPLIVSPSAPPPVRLSERPPAQSSMQQDSPPSSPSLSSEAGSSSADHSGWESDSSAEADNDNANVQVDFEGPDITFSSSTTM